MSLRHGPGVNYLTGYRCERAGKTAMALNEMNSNEEPTAGAMGTYIWLPRHTYSPAAYVDIASKETPPKSRDPLTHSPTDASVGGSIPLFS